jgi:hypothetical protein
MELLGSLSRIEAAATLFCSHEPRITKIQKENMNLLVGMVYLHQHGLDASGKGALERVLAGDSVVLDLLQLLCVGLVGLLLELGNDL